MLNRDSQSRRFLLWRLVEVPNCQRCVFSHNRAFRNQPHTRQNHEFVLILTGVRDEVDLAQWDFHDLSLEGLQFVEAFSKLVRHIIYQLGPSEILVPPVPVVWRNRFKLQAGHFSSLIASTSPSKTKRSMTGLRRRPASKQKRSRASSVW